MPGISAIVRIVSSIVSANLVASSRVQRQLVVAGATNATPIVVTTTAPHGFGDAGKVADVVITGVVGNTAANGTVDPTSGIVPAWVARVVDATSFALYAITSADGTLAPVAGSGTYASGGTVSVALTDARILLGREHIFEGSSAPRIVFIPMQSPFSGKDVYSRSVVAGQPSAEATRQRQQRSIRTEQFGFEVHVWGQAVPPDPDLDFDETQALYHAVIQGVHLLTAGTYELQPGTWQDQQEGATQLVKAGHQFVFGISFGTPILGQLLPLAPVDTTWSPTTNLLVPGGLGEVGCTG